MNITFNLQSVTSTTDPLNMLVKSKSNLLLKYSIAQEELVRQSLVNSSSQAKVSNHVIIKTIRQKCLYLISYWSVSLDHSMASFEESVAVVPLFTTTAKRYQGTYRAIARVEWTTLLAKEFGQPGRSMGERLHTRSSTTRYLTISLCHQYTCDSNCQTGRAYTPSTAARES
jgi:hypothetical protein